MSSAKLSPDLRLAIGTLSTDEPELLKSFGRIMSMSGVSGEVDSPQAHTERILVPVIVELEHAGAPLPEGVRVVGRLGRFATALVPLLTLERSQFEKSVVSVAASRITAPKMNLAHAATNYAHLVATRGWLGRGVIVGVIDTGIDGSHPAFGGRILRVWDQTDASGPGVSLDDKLTGAEGRELVGAAVSAATDEDGHGTHVAGIAAGAHGPYTGVAPLADLMIVKTTFQTKAILEGVVYLIEHARRLYRPLVINLSLGMHADPHDGSDAFSKAISEACVDNPSVVICCAAGNEGDEALHAEVTLTSDRKNAFDIQVDPTREPAPKKRRVPVVFSAWYYDGIGEVHVQLEGPDGSKTTEFSPGSGGDTGIQMQFAGTLVSIFPAVLDPESRQFQIFVVLSPKVGATVTPGTWRLHVRAVATRPLEVHAWIARGENIGDFASRVESDRMKIGAPGAAKGSITVAAVTTRNSWIDANGRPQSFPALRLFDAAPFSSDGPLRDGTPKPDVAAPGQWLIAARSGQSSYPDWLHVDASFLALQGTSMATPFVSGLAALILEGNPSATCADVKSQLIAASQIPGRARGVYDRVWGWGLVDAGKL